MLQRFVRRQSAYGLPSKKTGVLQAYLRSFTGPSREPLSIWRGIVTTMAVTFSLLLYLGVVGQPGGNSSRRNPRRVSPAIPIDAGSQPFLILLVRPGSHITSPQPELPLTAEADELARAGDGRGILSASDRRIVHQFPRHRLDGLEFQLQAAALLGVVHRPDVKLSLRSMREVPAGNAFETLVRFAGQFHMREVVQMVRNRHPSPRRVLRDQACWR